MLYLEYIVLAALVVFLSVRLSYYVDCLDKKTSLSGAFIGGVMLAAVTSLPELFSISDCGSGTGSAGSGTGKCAG